MSGKCYSLGGSDNVVSYYHQLWLEARGQIELIFTNADEYKAKDIKIQLYYGLFYQKLRATRTAFESLIPTVLLLPPPALDRKVDEKYIECLPDIEFAVDA